MEALAVPPLDRSTAKQAEPTGLATLAEAPAILLTTFRRNGTPVGTPVWGVVRDGAVYATTARNTRKAGRIRNDPRVVVAPCTQKGEVTGPAIAGRARFLDPAETRQVQAAIRRRYGIFGVVHRIFTVSDRLRGFGAHVAIEVVPDGTTDAPASAGAR